MTGVFSQCRDGSQIAGSRPEPPSSRRRLLVSVRDAAEADLALAAGVDLLDVKEPGRGSLGRADAVVVRAVQDTCTRRRSATPVSAALGELRDLVHNSSHESGAASGAKPVGSAAGELWSAYPLCGLSYVKLGLAGMADVPDWSHRWRQIRETLSAAAQPHPQWVAVAYADAGTASAPSPEMVIDAAAAAGCAGVLFDTYCKQSPGLLSCLRLARLTQLAERVRSAEMFCAAAGKLRLRDVEILCEQPLDVLAVRSAACVGEDRTARLCSQRLRSLQNALRRPDWEPPG